METRLENDVSRAKLLGCVRTIVVWKQAVEFMAPKDGKSCVRTIVVWKQGIDIFNHGEKVA